jgi:hypothetical protein
MAGPAGPGLGSNASSQFPSWRFAASSTPRALAPARANLTAVAQYDAVTVVTQDLVGNRGSLFLLVCTTAGTTASSQPTLKAGPGLVDGSVTWTVYALGAGASNGGNIQNTDASALAWGGDVNVQNAAIMPSGGVRPLLTIDPSAYYVTSSGTPLLSVEIYL